MSLPEVLTPGVAIIGGGPAGLMAAEVLAAAGHPVTVFDAKPSVGRKFLLAGKGGLNLTHSEDFAPFVGRFGDRAAQIEPLLRGFDAEQLRAWAEGLGVSTFVGTSGRVFPTDLKAAPLLRAWLHRLRAAGVRFSMRHRWTGWSADGHLRFDTPEGERLAAPRATLLALGGASWPQLGSDGAWEPWLTQRGVDVAPLQPANCGFDVGPTAAHPGAPGWSERFATEFAGQPVKPVALATEGFERRAGEFVITASGIEGSLVYAASRALREQINRHGQATLHLDLLPQLSAERVLAEVKHPRGSRSLSSHLKSRLHLSPLKLGLLHEQLTREQMLDATALATALKQLPLTLHAPRPVAEAISTAGGVRFEALTDALMLRALPGVFVAGEMLDWEAPTGGYLLTASMACGKAAALGVCRWLELG
ncbi:TIGR03862 family flavoprotein [Roseateles puraquae]|uniref:Aminoacetone oxidase family FAD-binding enzyme n=1 Tax=Roseateles puraquae TaxID=431059 RepID=A0A254NME9_9BURK|nr:TIGR03862 family flavoprotein [Roseateles puraquae]MDG0853551.1 TIGR03862 family flavoprotein [Roseateles puraquae]OWR05723.1 aminoacetone oxidase family FAD-binding enzyme [Roseateles puraquae]